MKELTRSRRPRSQTEINQSQAELSRVANDLTLLIERANAPIFGIDSFGMVNEWVRVAGFKHANMRIARPSSAPPIARWIPNVAQNRKAVHITGFSKEEVVGQDLVRKFITAVGAADFELAVSRVRVNIR